LRSGDQTPARTGLQQTGSTDVTVGSWLPAIEPHMQRLC
jgi:ABC-type proline/glycine betaine transport system substrate-binding protein